MLLNFVLTKGTSEETTMFSTVLIADTNSSDVILGMDFLGPSFGMLDPLREEFLWRGDCRGIKRMLDRVARLLAGCRSNNRERRHNYMIGLVTDASNLANAVLEVEEPEDDLMIT